MKLFLILFFCSTSTVLWVQEPFEKDGKWGLSKNGDANDSVIFKAEFEKIEMLVISDGYLPIGLKRKQWYPMTSNPMLNQQGYEEIYVTNFNYNIVIAARDGYIDVIDIEEKNFLLRNVKATGIVNDELDDLSENYIITLDEKKMGLISLENKKEILKAKYVSIVPDAENSESEWLFAAEEGKTSVFDKSGELIFELSSSEQIVSMIEDLNSPNLYRLMSIDGAYGMYNSSAKWLVEPIYIDVVGFKGVSEVVVVSGKKGDGLFFNGKQLLEPKYITIDKSLERGFLANVIGKKGEFLLSPEGVLSQLKVE